MHERERWKGRKSLKIRTGKGELKYNEVDAIERQKTNKQTQNRECTRKNEEGSTNERTDRKGNL